MRFGYGHEPLIRKGGVYFVKAQTVNACVRADGCTEKTREYSLMGDQKTREYEVKGAHEKIDAHKLMASRKTDAYELMESQKTDAYELMDSQKTDAYELMDSQKTDAYKLMDSQKTDAYKLMDSQKIDEYEMTGALNPCVQTKKVKNPCVKNSSFVGVRKNDGVEIIHIYQRKRACQDADVKPVVRDPMDDDRVLVESGAEMTPVPQNRNTISLTSHFNPCVKGNAQAEPHKRKERIIEDSELPVIQCDYLMLKDVAGTGGLKVLSMYVKTFGYGMSTVVKTKRPTEMFATMWAVKMLNCLGLSDIILQCDPEPSLIQWAENVKSKRTERTVIRSSHRRSHQSNVGVENYQKQLQGQVRTMLAAMQEHTQY